MVAKKKAIRAKFTASGEQHASSKKTESREPVITQVVEVIEIESTQGDKESTLGVTFEEKDTSSVSMKEKEVSTQSSELNRGKPEMKEHEASRLDDQIPDKEDESNTERVVEELFKKDSLPDVSEISIHTESSTKSIVLWAVVVVVVALATGIGLVMATKKSVPGLSFGQKPTPTVAPTVAPSPTPTLTQKKEDVKIEVLNGGGIAGAASKMKAFLEDKGYDVPELGNADEYNYEQTEIAVKSGMNEIAVMIRTDLESTYTVSDTVGTLPEDSSVDVRVIVGKE